MKNNVRGVNTVSIGDLGSATAHPREVFKPAILANAASILMLHNHPSGDPTPSADDIDVSRRINDAGQLLGIELLDHVVIGGDSFVSMKEKGLY
jgi:DNA repair protein RadC